VIRFDLDYKIIDMHTHMGQQYPLYYPEHDADSMVRFMDEAGVELIISCPCEDLFTPGMKRRQIIDAMTKYPGRIKGYYGVSPLSQINLNDIKAAFVSNKGFAGIKVLPDYHRTALTSAVYAPVFEFADEYKLLVLSHTWDVSMNGESCNSADKVVEILEKYKNMTFIMGHSIQGQADLAIEIAKSYHNSYLDTCDTCRLNGLIEKIVDRVGAQRLVFGTDFPMQGTYHQLGAVLGARITDKDRKMILRDNALRIMTQPGRP